MNLEEMAQQQREYAARTQAAQAAAAQALARLIALAERSDSGQASRIAQFIAATYNGNAYTFDLFDLRAVDVEISDDMLSCLDALRWGKSDLYHLVPDGDRRIQSLCATWGIQART
jgi:uncharacterized membrane protein